MTPPRLPPRLIETERLFLRAVEIAMAERVHEAIVESWPELSATLLWATDEPEPFETTLRQLRDRAAVWAKGAENGEKHLYILFEKASERVVGGVSLKVVDWAIPRFEMGYWTRSSDAGRGYMSEAVRAVAQCALDDLGAKRVQIHCSSSNPASARVAIKAGFIREAALRNAAIEPGGKLADQLIHSRIPGDGAAPSQSLSASEV